MDITPVPIDITPYTSTNRHHSLYRYQWTSLPIPVPIYITPYTNVNRHHTLYQYQWTSLTIPVPMDILDLDTNTMDITYSLYRY